LAIDASAGMNTSQGTPSCAATKAAAWAWLPALATMMPACACRPSEASLFDTPRTLNDPVRCRFSAL
jgi:hypothetical protein